VRAPPSLQVSVRIEAALKIAPLANQAWQQHSGWHHVTRIDPTITVRTLLTGPGLGQISHKKQRWEEIPAEATRELQPKPKGYSQKFQAGQPPVVPRAEKEKPSAQPWDKEVEEVLAEDPQEEKTRQKEEMQEGFKEAESVPISKQRSAKEKLRLLRAPSRMNCNRQAVS
jgi:hypothetical protein